MRAVSFVVLLVLSCVVCQNLQQIIVIDDYTEGFNVVTITLNSTLTTSSTPVTKYDSSTAVEGPTSKHILGGVRDLIFTASVGVPGYTFSTLVTQSSSGVGSWSVTSATGQQSNTTDVVGNALTQYDSTNGTTVNPKGFTSITGTSSGIDLTNGGAASAFYLKVTCDLGTKFTISVYSPNGGICTATHGVAPGVVKTDIYSYFNNFTGNCQLTNVGAIELNDLSLDAVNTVFYQFGVYGPVSNPSSSSPSPLATGGFTWYNPAYLEGRQPCGPQPPRRPYFQFSHQNNVVYYYFYKFEEYYNEFYGQNVVFGSAPSIAVSIFAGLLALFAL